MESDILEACIMSSSWFRRYAVEHRKRMSLHTYLLGRIGTKRYKYISRKAATSHSGKIVSPEREKREEKGCNTHQYYLTLPLPLYLHENDTSYIVREELAIKKTLPPYQSDTHTHIHSYTYTHTLRTRDASLYAPDRQLNIIVFISGFITKVGTQGGSKGQQHVCRSDRYR